jgi:hypothetical protein
MQHLTPEARRHLDEIAVRHGVSADAALSVLRALATGGGTAAQFEHPELGGMGQWSQSGMTMIADMFNHGLKQRVGALCAELAALLRNAEPFTEASSGQVPSLARPGAAAAIPASSWWPAELGVPASSGAQNDTRYAFFPAFRRLAVQQGVRLSLYDTGTLRISGVSQQQGSGRSLTFSSDQGAVSLQDLQLVDAAAGTAPALAVPDVRPGAPSATAGSDPLATIERLADLHAKGVLTAEEFAAKKAELLARV